MPNNPPAIRNYDGLEVRLTKDASRGWAGMFSYTWSRLWGNYTGLTTTDQIDGGTTGRDSPDTTRSFDEPFYYFKYQGKSNSGPLPTDRPNAVKGNVYYPFPWKGMTSTIGLFQVAYQGSPVRTASGSRYQMHQPDRGHIRLWSWQVGEYHPGPSHRSCTFGNPYARRTPWYTQTDVNFAHF